MKISKVFSSLFGILGTVLLIASIGVCLLCRNWTPQNQGVPQAADAAADQFIQALSAGDFASAGNLIYGQPELGAEGVFHSDAAARIWEGFRESFVCQSEGGSYLESTDIYRNVTLSYLDVAGVLRETASFARTTGDEAEEPDTQLLTAMDRALSEGKTLRIQGKLRMIEDQGHWYVIPDKTVLSAISGGLQ